MLNALVAVAAAVLVAGGVLVVERTWPTLLHRRSGAAVWTIVAASAAVAAVADVEPTGIAPFDALQRAGIGAAVALAAGRARRDALLVAGALVAIGSGGAWPWGVVAFVALGLAAGSAGVRRPARPVGTLFGALLAQALLRLGWPDTPYATALVATVAVVVLVVSGVRHTGHEEQRRAKLVLGFVAVVAVVGAGVLLVGVLGARSDLVDGVRAVDSGLAAVRAADTERAVDDLATARFHLGEAGRALDAPWMAPARLLPVAGRYLGAAEHVVDAADGVLEPALESARLADGEALRITAARVDLDAVAALEGPLDRTLEALPQARAALAALRSETLPGPVATELDDADDELVQAGRDGAVARSALAVLPDLLGADRPRRWFLAMQTPSEQRASGGILGAFGELVADDGQLDLVKAGTVGDIGPVGDWQLSPPVAEQYRRFPGFGPSRFFQNVTQVPHFPTVGRAVTELYPQAGGQPLDGVISVDPKVLGALLSLTGPIEVSTWPEPITAGNVERVLLYDQYRELSEGDAEQLVADVIEATFAKIRSSALPPPAQILKALSPMVAEQRLKLYAVDEDEQGVLAAMGADGAMPDVDDDSFLLVTQNSGESKIDWFQRRAIRYSARHDPLTGEVQATARVTITNGAPARDEPPLVIGGLVDDPGPLGRSRLFVEFFTPLDLDAVTVDGVRTGLYRDRQHGRNVYWIVHTLLPGQSVTFELHLSGTVPAEEPYRLHLGRQPVIAPDDVTVTVESTGARITGTGGGLEERDGVATLRLDQQEPQRLVVRSQR